MVIILKKRKLKVKKIIWFILFLFSLFLIIFSLINIFNWNHDNKKTTKINKEIQKIVEIKETEPVENIEIIEPTEEIPKSNPYWDYIKMNMIDVDFHNLKTINSDVKGWIQILGTNVNYPFVQTKDNDYYLTHSFNQSKNSAGWLFMDYRNVNSERNTIIYGHGRLDNTMFGSLKRTLKKSWYQNLNNHIIKTSTEAENSLWQIFSIYHIPTTADYLQVYFTNDDDYTNFLDMIQNRSQIPFDTVVEKNDHILTVSTCYNDKEKLVIHAKLIKREKKAEI